MEERRQCAEKRSCGVCRRSLAFVAKEEDGVHVKLGGGRGGGHDDDNDGSCNNSGDGNGYDKIKGEIVRTNLVICICKKNFLA